MSIDFVPSIFTKNLILMKQIESLLLDSCPDFPNANIQSTPVEWAVRKGGGVISPFRFVQSGKALVLLEAFIQGLANSCIWLLCG